MKRRIGCMISWSFGSVFQKQIFIMQNQKSVTRSTETLVPMFRQHHEKTCIIYIAGYYLKKKQEKNTKHIALPYYMSSLKVKEEVRTHCLFFCYRDIWSDRYITLSSLLPFPFGEELLLTGNPQSSNCQWNDLPFWTLERWFQYFGTGKNSHTKKSHSFFNHVPSSVPLISPDITIRIQYPKHLCCPLQTSRSVNGMIEHYLWLKIEFSI